MQRLVGKLVSVFCLLAASFAGETASAQQDSPSGSELAASLAESTETSRGICAVLGWDDESFLLELAQSGELLVHAWDPREAKVAAARRAADAEDLHGTRLLVERGPLGQLPYADDTLDLVLAAHLTPGTLSKLSATEILRALRPEGKAVIGQAKTNRSATESLSRDQLESWLKQAGLAEAAIRQDDLGLWVEFAKPTPAGIDDWSHWEHSPDNNPLSKDTVIKAPYMTKWLGAPYYISMPAITTAAGGRIFNAIGHIAHHKREENWLNTLLARNGYNGTVLWTRKLPSGYLVHRSAFIATDDVFYMIDTDGSGCLMLDPETGQERGRIDIPGARGQWKWMALHKGILFALVGAEKDSTETTIVRSKLSHWSWGELSKGYYLKRVPWGFGRTLVAYDLAAKKRLWTHREKKPIDSRAMVIGEDRIFLYSPDARMVCLDTRSGDLLWENADPKVRELIEEEGSGLSSTPGFRSMTFCVFTPDALIFQAQTRQNVVSISTADGYLLWNKEKTTNNPNALYLEDGVALGIGEDGTTLLVDPHSGETLGDLGFKKRSCARLTATSDSLFCRGWPEGLTRYDRNKKKVQFNGAVRPGCNDGIVAANGLLYAGPWPCDCNLMLLGRVALTSAGAFKFDHLAGETDRLEVGAEADEPVDEFGVTAADWPTYRGGHARTASTNVPTPDGVSLVWENRPRLDTRPTAATAAGGLIFLAADDGKVRALEALSGKLKWSFLTAGPIMQPPSIWEGRVFVGSGDGYVYALEATSGRLLWRFRAAPVERRIPVYGKLSSTWPVHSGVLAADGVVYAAAGIIDYDGTYVYALDARTGTIKWQNNSTGHLDPELRKGVSANGDLTLAGGRLWMPAGNVVSPAAYDLASGEYLGGSAGDGSPKANRGEEIGIFRDNYLVHGGRLRFSPIENVVNPGSFVAHTIMSGRGIGMPVHLHRGKIPPAWDDKRMAMVDGRLSVPACYDASEVEKHLQGESKPKPAWIAEALQGADVVALSVSPNAVLAVYEMAKPRSRHSQWVVAALNADDGSTRWERILPGTALPGGLTVDRDGRVLVVLADGTVICYGDDQVLGASVARLTERARRDPEARQEAFHMLSRALRTAESKKVFHLALRNLEALGFEIDAETRRSGGVSRWQLIGPVPWKDEGENDTDKVFFGEPDVDVSHQHKIGGRVLKWRDCLTDDRNGKVDLTTVYGRLANVAAYAYAEVELPASQDLQLKIGSNDGYKCWFNGKEVSRFEGGRGYRPDQNSVQVEGRAGVNRILLKITQFGSRWAFGVRLTDLKGQPVAVKHLSQ